MSKKQPKDGLTKEPLKHSPFAGMSLDSLLGDLDTLHVPTTLTNVAQAETPKPKSVTPAGTSDLMDDGGEEDFGPETADGLDTAPANTSLLPPPMFEDDGDQLKAPAIPMARAINVYSVTGHGQKPAAGVETEPFILDARYDDGTAAIGEPVFWMVVEGSGELTLSDETILQDGSAATSFTPDNDGPYKIVAIIGRDEAEVEVSFASAAAKAEVIAPTPEFVEAMDRALPTTSESVPPAAEAADTEAVVEAIAETTAKPTATEAASPAPAAEVIAPVATATETMEEVVVHAPAEPTATAVADPASATPGQPPEPSEVALARAELELSRELGLTTEEVDHISNPAPTEEEINKFLLVGTDRPDTRKVSIPAASPIPREEKGAAAAARRAVLRTHKLGWKHLVGAVAMITVIAIAFNYMQGTDTEATSSAANLPMSTATDAPAAKTAIASSTVEYRCEESTRTADSSDGQYDILTCARVAK